MGMINSYYSYRALICWKLLVKENGSGCGSSQEYESYQIISCNSLLSGWTMSITILIIETPDHIGYIIVFIKTQSLMIKKKK